MGSGGPDRDARQSGCVGQANPTVVRKDYDMRKLATETQLSKPELAGRRLFVQRCAICHDQLTSAVAQERVDAPTLGPQLDRETIKKLGDAGARLIIANGSERMPGFQYALTPVQVGHILAFLSTVQQKPPPAAPPAPAISPPGASSNVAAPTLAPVGEAISASVSREYDMNYESSAITLAYSGTTDSGRSMSGTVRVGPHRVSGPSSAARP